MARITRLALVLLCANAAWAQYVVSARAGTIHFIRGQVSVDGQPIVKKLTEFPVLREGQILRTGNNGRAEILLGSGVFLRLGEQGALRMLDTRLEDTQVEVQQGTALVEVVDMPRGSDVHVVVGPTRTAFAGMGLYRFEAGAGELRVFGGHAMVVANGWQVEATRGKIVHLGDTLALSKFDPHQKDALHQWAARRSFLLFTSNPLAMMRQSNWETRVVRPASGQAMPSDRDIAFLSNRDFGVMYQSRAVPHAFLGPEPVPPPPPSDKTSAITPRLPAPHFN